MDAVVTVRMRLPNICADDKADIAPMTFEECVRWLVSEEGLFGIADLESMEITEVREAAHAAESLERTRSGP